MGQAQPRLKRLCCPSLPTSSPFTPIASERQASTLCQISKAPHGVLEVARRPQADGAEGQAWGAIVSDVPLTGPPRTLTGVWPWLEAWQLRQRCPVVFKE